MDLDNRKRLILQAVIDSYIRTGEPVGSKFLSHLDFLKVSSATIRNEMSELERMGYLTKPHTSAGRIPSNDGYRYYVRTSTDSYRLTDEEIEQLMLPNDCAGLYQTVHAVASRLAEFLGFTVFAVSPSCSGGVYTFEVLPAGKHVCAVLAISSGGGVKTAFAKTEKEICMEDARKFASILNEILSKFPIEQIGNVRMMLLSGEVARECPNCVGLLDAVKQLVEQLKSYELMVCGSENLFSYPEFSGIEAAKSYIHLLSAQERILEALLSSGGKSDNPDIKIGDENPVFRNSHASMISIGSDSKIPVVLGVMGPTRMNYARTVAGCRFLINTLKNIIDEEY